MANSKEMANRESRMMAAKDIAKNPDMEHCRQMLRRFYNSYEDPMLAIEAAQSVLDAAPMAQQIINRHRAMVGDG
jgi:hypothetical protein